MLSEISPFEDRTNWGFGIDRPMFVRINLFDLEEARRCQLVTAWTIQLFHLPYVCRLVQVNCVGPAVLLAGHEPPLGWIGNLFDTCLKGGAPCPLDWQVTNKQGRISLNRHIREGWALIRND